ncbi:Uncharacterized protein L484_024556 [Morus notabilis]|uniref:DNA/RNA-binding protein Alba-like domain-containing protein n=1 Tax=Morus notabilis TaxID=981085 RepID=W9RI44_9ROSA|nr:Uncharacterized protein L484_024556 [Morus notabilis]
MATVAVPQAQSIHAQKKNRIQVSNTKKPLFFYVNLAKRYIQQHNEVELSALGMAITTVVTISEILKNNGLATEKKVSTSTVGMKDENKGRLVQKAKIEIVLGKSEKFDSLVAASTVAPEPANDENSKEEERFVVTTEASIRMLTAEDHSVALLNLAVPSPIFRETEPIFFLLLVSFSAPASSWSGSVSDRVRFVE